MGAQRAQLDRQRLAGARGPAARGAPDPGRRQGMRRAVRAGAIPRYRHVMRAFGPDVRKQRGKLGGGVVFAVLYALTRVAEPWPLQVVFDDVLFHKHHSHGVLAAPFHVFGSSATDILAAAALVLALTGLLRGVSYYYQDFL